MGHMYCILCSSKIEHTVSKKQSKIVQYKFSNLEIRLDLHVENPLFSHIRSSSFTYIHTLAWVEVGGRSDDTKRGKEMRMLNIELDIYRETLTCHWKGKVATMEYWGYANNFRFGDSQGTSFTRASAISVPTLCFIHTKLCLSYIKSFFPSHKIIEKMDCATLYGLLFYRYAAFELNIYCIVGVNQLLSNFCEKEMMKIIFSNFQSLS